MAEDTPEPGTPSKPNVYYGTTVSQGERMLKYSVSRDPTVKFLLGALAKQGCAVGDKFFAVKECGEDAAGGFLPGEGVVICANHVALQDEVNTILAHELVHAYDHCRAKNMDWSDLHQHACSEVRAANLSGQCHLNRELLLQGSQFKFREGHKRCVRRKAELSVAMNPFSLSEGSQPQGDVPQGSLSEKQLEAMNRKRRDAAASAVEAVWERCYRDTAPFTGIP